MRFLNTLEDSIGKDVSLEDHNHYSDELAKKTLTGSVTSAAYFTFAKTPINPTEYSGLFKITVTSQASTSIKHILYVWVAGEGNTAPYFNVFTKTNNSTAATTGLYYLRGVYPKNLNNGYGALLEFYCYNTTQRDIIVELIEANNLDLLNNFTASTYSSTYQSVTTPAVLYNGFVTNGTIYGTLSGSVSGNATSSNYLYSSSFVAGEALIANDILFLSGTDNKWYKVNVAGRSIPSGTILARCAGTYAINATVGAYNQGYFNLPTGLTGTINKGKDLFIRGQLSGNNLVTDGSLTTEVEIGFSYIRLGSVVNTTAYLNYDGNNRVYTLGANGIDKIDGLGLNIPTNLSEFNNDLNMGLIQTVSSTTPTSPVNGQVWINLI